MSYHLKVRVWEIERNRRGEKERRRGRRERHVGAIKKWEDKEGNEEREGE